MKKSLIILCILLTAVLMNAQYYGKNKIQAEKIHWNKIQTMHFDIYYPDFDDSFGKIAALCAEEAYYRLREDFRTPVKHRIPVIFYSSHQDFKVTNIIPNLLSEGVGGFTESMHNRVAMPFSGSYREMEKTLTHELTHAYVNELAADRNTVINTHSLPFWLSEGLPEFISVNGSSVYNNMFIMDLIYNNDLINLQQVGGYYAYREGESFLKYIEDEYGRDKVMDIFYSARVSDSKFFARKIFDMDFDDLQTRWENHLKRIYFGKYNNYQPPYEVWEQLTDAAEDGSSMNIAPRFAPNGVNYAWFSNKNITSAIWYADRLELNKPKKIFSSEVNGNAEEFHFRKSNIAFMPDGSQMAFAANTSFGDIIHFMDIKKRDIINSVSFDSIKVIYEIDISPDGSKLAFAGIQDTYTDLYIHDLVSHNTQRITHDRYYDAAPCWSPDGSKLAFHSERLPINAKDSASIFGSCVNNIYYYDLKDSLFYQVTDSLHDCTLPKWTADSNAILYLTDDGTVSNIWAVDIHNAAMAQVTKAISGVLNFDLSADNDNLLVSCFDHGAWDVFAAADPLAELAWTDYHFPAITELDDDFWDAFNIERINYYGKTNLTFRKPGTKRFIEPELAERYDITIDYGPDTTIVEYNRQVDRKPTVTNEPQIVPYKAKFKIDYFWGGMAYSSSGTYAMLDVWASDILGNHSLYGSMNISGSLENSSILLQYLNLENRNDYGGGTFYLNDETIYRIDYGETIEDDYYRKRIREYGVFGIFVHPFNKYIRGELQLSLMRQQTFRDWWDEQNGEWHEQYLDPVFANYSELKTYESSWFAIPQLSLVHDNTLYGSTGPIAGWKGFVTFRQGISADEPYSMAYADLRKYDFFAKRYSWANRALVGWIDGEDVSEFDLVGFYGVRGFDDDDVTGKKKFMLSTEFRFPMIDNLSLGFPLPLQLGGVRGSAFVDLGVVWDNADQYHFANEGRLVTPKLGIGFGPRINLGFFVLKFDVAWQTDLVDISKPRYYLWLIEDF